MTIAYSSRRQADVILTCSKDTLEKAAYVLVKPPKSVENYVGYVQADADLLQRFVSLGDA